MSNQIDIDFRIANKTIAFALQSTEDPHLRAKQVVKQYDLPVVCEKMLANKFKEAQLKQIQP